MSQVIRRGPTAPEMNMTPLIDVTFQLIIFFMLVSNIVSAELVEMVTPVLEDSLAHKLEETDRVVVNITPVQANAADRTGDVPFNGHLNTTGEASTVRIGVEDIPLSDLPRVTEALRGARERFEAGGGEVAGEEGTGLQVLVRADAAIYYDDVSAVLQSISEAGIKRVNLVAYTDDGAQRLGLGGN